MKIIKEAHRYKLSPFVGVKLKCPNCEVILQLENDDHVTEIPGETLGVINCPTKFCGKQLRINRDRIN